MRNVTSSFFSVLQTWFNNMGKAGEACLKPFDGDEYTCITFRPDLPKFKMTILDKDTVALMTRRAYDIAGASKGVKVFFNGKKLPVSMHTYTYVYAAYRLSEASLGITRGLFCD